MPLTFPITRAVFSESDELLFLSQHPALNSHSLHLVPITCVGLLVSAPFAYAIFFSNAGKRAQASYNRTHATAIRKNITKLHAPVALTLLGWIWLLLLAIRISSVVGIVLLLLTYGIATCVLRIRFPAVEPI
jgi:hypothetical protein